MSTEPSSSSPGSRGQLSRRRLFQAAGVAAAAAATASLGARPAGASAAGQSAQTADYVLPAGFAGTIADLKHVVVLMLENRSFDHYLGQLPGVRGHSDRQVLKFQDGTDVFQQRASDGTIVTPYASTSTWGDNHNFYSADNGRWDTWVPDKGSNCMGYYDPSYMPFYYSLASQYTVCDQYFCSIHGPTIPNRLYLMSGTSGGTTSNSGQNLYNRSWVSVADQLQEAGLDWRVYSDNSGNGLGGSVQSGWIGEYGCNVVNCFSSFDPRTAPAADLAPLGKIWRGNAYLYADTGVPNENSEANLEGVLSSFIDACQPGADYPLAEISYIVMPADYSEHPDYTTVNGERYTQKVLGTLQSNPDIWNHTLLIITYDENDGKFDHVLPPRPEPGTAGEFASNGWPYGFGPRVPMLMVSPWTRGGYVASETFDHTSVINFLELWASYLGKPFKNPNISGWRRSISGDLTSAIDFTHPILGTPTEPDPVTGTAPALTALTPRDLSYSPHATVTEDRGTGQVTATMTLTGGPFGKAVSMQVFPDKYQAFSNTPFTVTADSPRTYTWDTTQTSGSYAFSIYSNDGFVRSFAGQVAPAGQTGTGIPRADAELSAGGEQKVKFRLYNDGTEPVTYQLAANDYTGGTQTVTVQPGTQNVVNWPTQNGYYDVILTVGTGNGWTQRYAGRVARVAGQAQ